MSILRDGYSRVHLYGHRKYPEHRSLCGMVDIRWSWAKPHLTDDPWKTDCKLCIRLWMARVDKKAGVVMLPPAPVRPPRKSLVWTNILEKEKTMGTDYYLIDPKAQEVKYIDRSGSSFCCAHPGPERQEVEGWPHGPVRVVTAECLVALKEDLFHEGRAADGRTWDAYRWCEGRGMVLLVDDHSPEDEAAFSFCHLVTNPQGLPTLTFEAKELEGWTAAPEFTGPRFTGKESGDPERAMAKGMKCKRCGITWEQMDAVTPKGHPLFMGDLCIPCATKTVTKEQARPDGTCRSCGMKPGEEHGERCIFVKLPDEDLCLRCGRGRDTDGDGNCAYCAHLSNERLAIELEMLDGHVGKDQPERDQYGNEPIARPPFELRVEDHPEREWSQQELWAGVCGLLRDRGVDVTRMVLEESLRNSLRYGLEVDKDLAAEAKEKIPGIMSAESIRARFNLDKADFDAGTAPVHHTIMVLRSKDPGHGLHTPVFGAVFQEQWSGEQDPEAEGCRVGYGRDVMAALADLLGQGPAELDEGSLPSASHGLEMPREQLLEMCLADAYSRIEDLVQEREPILQKAERLTLSLEKREAIGEDWHPFFDQWLRTFAEWAARMAGGSHWGHRDAANLIRSMFTKLSGFKPQESPEPQPVYGPMTLIRDPPVPDQDRPRTMEMDKDPDPTVCTWERGEQLAARARSAFEPKAPRTVRDKSVTHEVVTRFNTETGYIAWRAHRIATGDEEVTPEVLARRVVEQLTRLEQEWPPAVDMTKWGYSDAAKWAYVRAKKVVCDVMAGVDVGDILDAVRLQELEAELVEGEPVTNVAMERLQNEVHSARSDANEAENRAADLEEQRDESWREAVMAQTLLETTLGGFEGEPEEKDQAYLKDEGGHYQVEQEQSWPSAGPWWGSRRVVGYLRQRGWAIHPDGMRPADVQLHQPSPFIPEAKIIGASASAEEEAERLDHEAWGIASVKPDTPE